MSTILAHDDVIDDSNSFLASSSDEQQLARKRRKITFQPINLENHQMPAILDKEINQRLFLGERSGDFNSPSSLLAGDRSMWGFF